MSDTMNKVNGETEVRDLGIYVPQWIEQDLTIYDVDSIIQGGCASGAYMPAVVYHKATQTMAAHGDDVLQYIEDSYGELPQPQPVESWSGIAVFYLSTAVELFAYGLESELEQYDRD